MANRVSGIRRFGNNRRAGSRSGSAHPGSISRYQPLAQPVCRMVEFCLYFGQTIEDDAFFLFRKEQGFCGVIGKEGIRPDLLSERRAFDQVGMKHDALCRRLHAFQYFRFSHLSRSETGNRTLLLIVYLPSVTDVTAPGLFQKEGIDAIIDRKVCGESGGLGQIDDIHQRVKRLQSEQPVMFVHRIQFYQMFCHVCSSIMRLQ